MLTGKTSRCQEDSRQKYMLIYAAWQHWCIQSAAAMYWQTAWVLYGTRILWTI